MVLFEIGVGIFHLKNKRKATMTFCLTESDQLDIEKEYVVRLRGRSQTTFTRQGR
jgi:hypothetical protein